MPSGLLSCETDMPAMLIEDSYIDFDKTAESGQCFRWQKNDGYWEAPVLAYNAKFRRVDDEHIEIVSEYDNEGFWRRYLGLERDYEHMLSVIDDEADSAELHTAYRFSSGVVILNQPFFETCVSFIISQNNNIPRIKNIIDKICQQNDGVFPDAYELGMLLENEDFGLGYRHTYLAEFCERYEQGNLSSLASFALLERHLNEERPSTEQVVDTLTSFTGIGPKVASCIALFSLGCIDCVPKDVWIKRAEKQYNIVWDARYAGFQQQLIFLWQKAA